jgi:hypothetical protein
MLHAGQYDLGADSYYSPKTNPEGWQAASIRASITACPETRSSEKSSPRSARPHANLNREFKGPRYIEWQWFLIPLVALTIIDFLYLQRWG